MTSWASKLTSHGLSPWRGSMLPLSLLNSCALFKWKMQRKWDVRVELTLEWLQRSPQYLFAFMLCFARCILWCFASDMLAAVQSWPVNLCSYYVEQHSSLPLLVAMDCTWLFSCKTCCPSWIILLPFVFTVHLLSWNNCKSTAPQCCTQTALILYVGLLTALP